MIANSFVISQDSMTNFNQIKGRKMTAFFDEKSISHVIVLGNGESLYYALEEKEILKTDSLILRRGEAYIPIVVVNAAVVFELFENVDCSIGGGIVDNKDLNVGVLLRQHGFQAPFDKASAIVSHQGDGYKIVKGHSVNRNP